MHKDSLKRMTYHTRRAVRPCKHDVFAKRSTLQSGFRGDQLELADGRDVETDKGLADAAILMSRLWAKILAHQLRHPLLHAAGHAEGSVEIARTAGSDKTTEQMRLRGIFLSRYKQLVHSIVCLWI